MKNVLIFFLFLVIISCGSQELSSKEAKIPEEKMIAIMVDLAISDATVEHDLLPTNKLIYQKKLTYYKSIFEYHGYSVDDFEESYAVYSEDLVHLSAMYDQVLEELSKKEIELKSLI